MRRGHESRGRSGLLSPSPICQSSSAIYVLTAKETKGFGSLAGIGSSHPEAPRDWRLLRLLARSVRSAESSVTSSLLTIRSTRKRSSYRGPNASAASISFDQPCKPASLWSSGCIVVDTIVESVTCDQKAAPPLPLVEPPPECPAEGVVVVDCPPLEAPLPDPQAAAAMPRTATMARGASRRAILE